VFFERYSWLRDAANPLLEASDTDFNSGEMANAQISYIDNIVARGTEGGLVLSVEEVSKLTTFWGRIKSF
jgi:hypothetical protein